MLREPLNDADACGLPVTLEAMGERWSFMILRAAFNGIQHFEEFQTELGIARNILANRLQRLVLHGILERTVMDCDRRKVRYQLTDKGSDLLVVMVAMRQWGEKWGLGVPSTPVLVDKADHRPVRHVRLESHDGRTLGKHDLAWLHAHEVRSLGEAETVQVAGAVDSLANNLASNVG